MAEAAGMGMRGVLAAALVLGLGAPAAARFEQIPGAAAPPAALTPAMPMPAMPMPAAGLGPSSDLVRGFGNDVPIGVALTQILPPGYQVAFGEGVPLATPVSWQGGQPWRATLTAVLTPLGLAASESGRIVYVQRAGTPAPVAPMLPAALPAAPPMAPMPAPAPMTAEPLPLAQAPAPLSPAPLPAAPPASELAAAAPPAPMAPAPMASTTAPLPPAPALEPLPALQPLALDGMPLQPDLAPAMPMTTVWTVERGRTLRQVLQEWGELGGWTVVWDSNRDYVILADATFSGDFAEATTELVRAFEAAEPPLIATFYRNRTIVLRTEPTTDLAE